MKTAALVHHSSLLVGLLSLLVLPFTQGLVRVCAPYGARSRECGGRRSDPAKCCDLAAECYRRKCVAPVVPPTNSPTMTPVPTFSCPPVGSPPLVLPLEEETTVDLVVSSSNVLCALVQRSADGVSSRPVGRSYAGFDWEAYAGDFESLPYTCGSSSTSVCSVTLPALDANTNATYVLTTYTYTPSSPKDEAARFLEQVTFGPTMSEIDSLTNTAGGMGKYVNWVAQQMTLPVSSHRQLIRERSNVNFEVSNYQSLVTGPCQKGTRYRKYAFHFRDRGRLVKIRTLPSGRKELSIGGKVRTVIDGAITDSRAMVLADDFYEICKVIDPQVLGQSLSLQRDGTNACRTTVFGGVPGNPIVQFFDESEITNQEYIVDLPGEKVTPIDSIFFGGIEQELYVTEPLDDPRCASIPVLGDSPELGVVGRTAVSGGGFEYWLHMSMFDTLDNTVEQPVADGGGAAYELALNAEKSFFKTRCSNAPRTFLNDDSCVLSSLPEACIEREIPDIKILMEKDTFRMMYDLTLNENGSGVYVYAITNLEQSLTYNDPPCKAGARSRWIPTSDCTSAVAVEASTQSIFAALLDAVTDTNQHLRDVLFPDSGTNCAVTDAEKFDFTVTAAGGQCWKNVHPDHLQVRDFTSWAKVHVGGEAAIKQFALDDTFLLRFPGSTPIGNEVHSMGRWAQYSLVIPNVGRFGDEVRYKDLPVNLQRTEIAEFFGELETSLDDAQVVVCGSPYEVSNIFENFGNIGRGGFDIATFRDRRTAGKSFERQRVTAWIMRALSSPDQLRQRVAWALSQIFVVAPSAINNNRDQTESFVTYYDIFVRNALGNYRDILKEVAYSPLMGEMLTYLNSKSTGYVYKTEASWKFADENFAREIMQLFSIGLNELNPDGTQKLLEIPGGQSVSLNTYTTDIITEYAKVWTGFHRRARRGNVEDSSGAAGAPTENLVDPMGIEIEWRDHFPKLGLRKQYIGDGWPLCSDLPSQHFLKKGATFRLLGSSSIPQLHVDPVAWFGGSPSRPELSSDSELRKKLCNFETPCNYQVKVELDEDLQTCSGVECDVSTLRVFAVDDVYYEYSRPACVNLAFYDNAKMVKERLDNGGFMCADPLTEVASTSCCNTATASTSTRREEFSGERVPFAMASDRCTSEGLALCQYPEIVDCASSGCDNSTHYWTSQSCGLRVKVDRQGSVAIVHKPNDSSVTASQIFDAVKEDTKSFFRVDWLSDVYALLQPASYTTQCSNIGCEISSDGFCICDASVSSVAAFASAPTREQVLSELHYGAFPISTGGTVVSNGVTLHPGNSEYGEDSVFEVVDEYGITRWRKNLKSHVSLGSSGPIFRNPVHFIALSDPELRDAQYETEAALDHYLYHPNTAPFIATRLAQRFGVSNPSPRFVKIIAAAFQTGSFSPSGSAPPLGSGQYGDLSATVAAVLLDREARTDLLTVDPVQGSLQEPFLKFIRLLRSLEYEGDPDYPHIEFIDDFQDVMGQEAYMFPNVFSFFKPEYQPAGLIGQAGLTSPEAVLLSGPKIINLMNAMLSFVKYGISSCANGVFQSRSSGCSVGDAERSLGRGKYSSSGATPADVVDELSILLTSGRLSEENRAIIEQAYDFTINSNKDATIAQINALQLLVTTAEFHTTGKVTKSEIARPEPEKPAPSTEPYKAVIYLMLEGGMDSFNLLVPHTCSTTNGKNVGSQYTDIRGSLAFTNDERSLLINHVDVGNNVQPCSEFAIHEELPLLKQLYDSDELLFFANTGVLDESGLDRTNYEASTVSQLFSHNSMQDEVKKIDPFNQQAGTGVLGRASDVLLNNGFNVDLLSIDDPSITVDGTPGVSDPPVIVSRFGATQFDPQDFNGEIYFNTTDWVNQLHQRQPTVESSVFGETWSDQIVSSIRQVESLQGDLEGAALNGDWNTYAQGTKDEEEALRRRLEIISRLMVSHDNRGTDRDLFYAVYEDWDHHKLMKTSIAPKFNALNSALGIFVDELKAQNLWDSTTIVVASEFARTLTPNNSDGSDHGWGGNYFILGGKVKGGRILGTYPDDLSSDGNLNIGRGRIVPTTSWDAIWSGVLQWLDVPVSALDICLPNNNINAPKFTETDLFTV